MKVIIFIVIILLFVVVLMGCVSKIKFEIVIFFNGSLIEIMVVLVQVDFNNNCIVDNLLCVVILIYNVVGKGLVVLFVLIGNIKFSSFDKENYKGEIIELIKNFIDIYFV